MLDQSIQELESGSLARIASAGSLEEQAVRVQVLGRKGALDQDRVDYSTRLREVPAFSIELNQRRNPAPSDGSSPSSPVRPALLRLRLTGGRRPRSADEGGHRCLRPH